MNQPTNQPPSLPTNHNMSVGIREEISAVLLSNSYAMCGCFVHGHFVDEDSEDSEEGEVEFAAEYNEDILSVVL